jgi:hypothetical protein
LADSYSPRRYKREYRDPSTRAYASAFYSQHWLSARYRGRLVRWLEMRPRARIRTRRFEPPFGFRDSTALYGELKVVWRFAKRVRLTTGYQYIQNAAHGVDHDRSYREHDLEPELKLRLFRPVVLRVQYRICLRSYTTEADPSFDPVYRDRRDEIRRFAASAVVVLAHRLAIEVQTIQSMSSSTRPHDVTITQEQTSWHRSQYSLGLRYRF